MSPPSASPSPLASPCACVAPAAGPGATGSEPRVAIVDAAYHGWFVAWSGGTPPRTFIARFDATLALEDGPLELASGEGAMAPVLASGDKGALVSWLSTTTSTVRAASLGCQ